MSSQREKKWKSIGLEFDNSSLIHKEVENECFEPQTVYNSFYAAGHFIIYLGWISFLDSLIVNMLVYLHVYSIQFDMWYLFYAKSMPRPSFVQENLYFILLFSKEIGEIIFSAWISAVACVYPSIPFILEILNACFWVLNLKYTLVTSIPILCLGLAITGAIQATPRTNFFFLSIAKTDLYSDLNL